MTLQWRATRGADVGWMETMAPGHWCELSRVNRGPLRCHPCRGRADGGQHDDDYHGGAGRGSRGVRVCDDAFGRHRRKDGDENGDGGCGGGGGGDGGDGGCGGDHVRRHLRGDERPPGATQRSAMPRSLPPPDTVAPPHCGG